MLDSITKITKDQARHLLDKARHAVVMKFPFIGEISLRMGLIPTRDSKNPTSTSDGSKIYIDLDFLSKLRKEELSYVIGHEVWHNVLLHPARKQTRDPKLFDLACDMEVNWLLEQNNKEQVFCIPYNAPMPPREIQGESCEVIYDWLVKNCQMKPNDNQSSMQFGQLDSGSSGKEEEKKDKSSQEKEDKNGQPCNGEPSNGGNEQNNHDWECNANNDVDRSLKQQPKKSKSLTGQFDTHRYIDKSEQEEDDGQGNKDNDFKPQMSKSFCEEMREATIAQLQKCALGQGAMPIGIESFVKKLEKPEIPWQEHLSQFITQIHTGKLEWTPPSRRHLYQDLYLQSHREKKIKIALAIDTSGSTFNILPNFFAEMESLMKSFDAYEITRIDCDAAVEKVVVYDHDSAPFSKNESKGIDWNGGGGTSFVPPFEYVKEKNLDIDALVYLTDGFGPAPKKAPSYPVLWVLPKDGSKDFCGWGKKVYMTKANCGWC